MGAPVGNGTRLEHGGKELTVTPVMRRLDRLHGRDPDAEEVANDGSVEPGIKVSAR